MGGLASVFGVLWPRPWLVRSSIGILFFLLTRRFVVAAPVVCSFLLLLGLGLLGGAASFPNLLCSLAVGLDRPGFAILLYSAMVSLSTLALLRWMISRRLCVFKIPLFSSP